MGSLYFLCIASLQGGSKLRIAACHNRRDFKRETPNINRFLSHQNYILQGPLTAKDIVQEAKEKMGQAGVLKLRKNGVAALEIVFSLPSSSSIDHRAYFSDCLAWSKEQFGEGNILSADVHLDEAAPHCHILILPLMHGRMQGNAMRGNRKVLQERHKSFNDLVASKYGLSRGKGSSKASNFEARRAVIDSLKKTQDPALKSAAWMLIRRSIESEPHSWAQCLGIDFEPRSLKTQMRSFTQIMTKKVSNDDVLSERSRWPSLANSGFMG